jgi:hypothetical protein
MAEAAKVRAFRPEELLRLSTIASKCWSDPVRRVEVIAAQKLGRIRAEEARRLANAEEK